jgi:hypothetical protein
VSPRPARPPGLDILEPGYAALFDAAVAVFHSDPRVRALWLSGSLARGDADRVSDLDLIVAVRDEDHGAFAASWREWLARITPTLMARELPFAPGSLYCVAPGRERLDVVVEKVSAVESSFHRCRRIVFDRDGLDGKVPEPAAPGPNVATIAHLVEEFFRDYGMFPVAVAREDWLLAQEGMHVVRTLLYRLFVEANAPLPPMGVKQWSVRLTSEQRALLESLPTGAADRESVLAANGAVAEAFVREARRICSEQGVAWPTELEEATRAYLRAWGLPALDGA